MPPARYRVEIEASAQKALAAVPKPSQRRIAAKIDGLAENPRPTGCKKLTGEDAYRVRVGDYRIVYTVNDRTLVVVVVKIGHRREVYR